MVSISTKAAGIKEVLWVAFMLPGKTRAWKAVPMVKALPCVLQMKQLNSLKQIKILHFLLSSRFMPFMHLLQTTQEKWAKYRQKAEDMGIAESAFEMGHFLPIRQVQDNPVYGGLVETMDDAVGVVLNALEEMGLADNTIVVFTSDNGGVAAGDAFATSNKPLRAGKGYQFEGGIREPFFIKVPWLNTSGKKSDVPVIGTDFYPTLLELAGAAVEA
jgi:membrane-anchored protein YejM (alkaline phosphatase superfamily)